MKKIDFWTPYFGNVGTIKATINSAEAIKKYSKSEVEISLFKIHSEWEGYEEDILEKNINIVDFNLKKYFKNLPQFNLLYRFSMIFIMLYSIPKLVSYFNKNKPDVIMAYLQGVTPLIARIFSKHKPKIILSIQGLPDFLASKEAYDSYPIYKKIESKIRILLWKLLYLKADAILTLTQKTKDKLIIFFNCEDKIIFVSNPVIDNGIVPKSQEIISDKLFLENDIILGVGRYTSQKDFKTLIKAFKEVKIKYSNIKLVILGEGEQREELQNLIESLNLLDHVILYGFVDNPYKYLHHSKLFVLSSLWEDPGHVLMEAAYLKIPIVASNCPNDVDIFLSHGEAGYLCEISDEKDMANKILKALDGNNNKKISLAYDNSLAFTDKFFYKKIVKCL
jgi:glycosyltransferase involved in cell wall biosynthesis